VRISQLQKGKDRPLQCPQCQSHYIGRWGTYQYRPRGQRYWCHSCKRTFNDLTHTLLHRSTRPLAYWLLATFLVCLTCSSRRIARESGIHIRTSYRWCWWLRNVARVYKRVAHLMLTPQRSHSSALKRLRVYKRVATIP
jgi:transposase-like protein